jgi:hypothetical protein
LGSIALASCSDRASFTEAEPPSVEAGSFSEEDRLVARNLSLGSSAALEAESGPYAQALRCRSAIGALTERFRQSATPTQAQLQAIEQTLSAYDRQVRSLGDQEGKSAGEIRQDLQEAAEEETDLATQGQLAIACLQRLQQSS